MSPDELALIRLWKEKRGEAEPEDLLGNLIVQLGVATEPLNRTWYSERNAGRAVTDVQRGSGTLSIGIRRRPWTGSSTISTPYSRPSSCCVPYLPAIQLLNHAASSDLRVSMMSEALEAQIKIDDGVAEPGYPRQDMVCPCLSG